MSQAEPRRVENGNTRCTQCVATNASDAAACWLCGTELERAATREGTSEGIDSGGPYRTHARVAGPRPDAARTGWTITLVAAVLIAVGIAVELARVAPGWLVPFACVALVTIMSLMATVRQQRWVDLAEGRVPMPEEPPSEPPGDPGDEAEMVRPPGVAALVLGALFWVIAMLFVLGGAFFIVVGIVCSGMGGGMH